MVKLLFDKLPVNFHVGAGYNVLRRAGWRLLQRTASGGRRRLADANSGSDHFHRTRRSKRQYEREMRMRKIITAAGRVAATAATVGGLCIALGVTASAQGTSPPAKPNILVIMGDDIGYWNISAYNRGMMGYHTPNIRPHRQ